MHFIKEDRGKYFSEFRTFFAILFLVLLYSECQAEQRAEIRKDTGTVAFVGSSVRGPREEPVKSRSKRTDQLESRAATFIPGIDPLKNVTLNPPYEDGKECSTGADPYTAEEAEIVKAYYNTPAAKNGSSLSKTHKKNVWKIIVEETNDRWKSHCVSQHCYLDEATQRLTCGRPEDTSYADGLSCLDGTKTSILVEHSEVGSISQRRQEALNERATSLYGHKCKAKKCYYDSKAKFYKCSSPSVHPIPILTLTLGLLSLGLERNWVPPIGS